MDGGASLSKEAPDIRGYTFIAQTEIQQLLKGIAEDKLNLDSLRIFAAMKLRNPKMPDFSLRDIKTGIRGQRVLHAKEALCSLIPRYDSLAYGKDDKPIKVSNAALRYIAKAATKAEAIVLFTYFLRRIHRKGYARFSYSLVYELSKLHSQAVSTAIRSLAKQGFIALEERSKKTHWATWRHGRKFIDGAKLWRVKRTTKDCQKIKDSNGAISASERQKIKAPNQTNQHINRGGRENFKESLLNNQSNGVRNSNKTPEKIKEPIVLELLTRNKILVSTNGNHSSSDSSHSELSKSIKIDYEKIGIQILADETLRAMVFMKGCTQSRWQLKQLNRFHTICEELMKTSVETTNLDSLQSQMSSPPEHIPGGS